MEMTTIVVRRPGVLDDFESMAREFWGSWDGGILEAAPGMDAYELKDEFVIKAELPGVVKEGLALNIDGDTLRIEAEKKEEEVKDATYYAKERHFGQYSRLITLPFPVDAEKASAVFEHGVLEIRLPKAEEAKSKRIEVK
jgi:HSP20 family protein